MEYQDPHKGYQSIRHCHFIFMKELTSTIIILVQSLNVINMLDIGNAFIRGIFIPFLCFYPYANSPYVVQKTDFDCFNIKHI